ncbi:hypothetical protein [Pseudodesulfovibrio piezophilus]|uniref:Uncharacterized protein n=1 Tax=Pseudodesulfovibrio piezophilus (strain DSM 21447 / JCM 15486 / C1TLV30) TaxID=1322246 RepID=M1WPQ5_PSEP2|nr:hypothetical protein [Pseudodesulfovibrio piezophilus]CCH48519.1 protein of unknown function [Pseudodesulfovibrio piezophilus C1TLV30]
MKADKMIYGGPNKLLGKYIKAYGDDLLTRRISDPIPNGWAEIVIDMFSQIKRYHPEAKIASMRIAPASKYSSGILRLGFSTPDEGDPMHPPKLPRSLKWITEQARKKTFSTCAACGHPVGHLTSLSLCALCACRIGVRHFSE